MEVQKTQPPTIITLRLQSKETTSTITTSGGDESFFEEKEQSLVEEKRLLYKHETVLEEGTQIFVPGKYVLPFAIPLGKDLPASMRYEHSSRKEVCCMLEYKLKIDISSKRKVHGVTERLLDVAAAPPSNKEILPRNLSFRTSPATERSNEIDARLVNSQLVKGGEVELLFRYRKNTEQAFDAFFIELLQVVCWNVHGPCQKHSPSIDLITTPSVVESCVLASTKLFIASKSAHDTPQPPEKITLEVPTSCLDTFHSHCIKVCHWLQITPNQNEPQVLLPLTIGNPPPANSQGMGESRAADSEGVHEKKKDRHHKQQHSKKKKKMSKHSKKKDIPFDGENLHPSETICTTPETSPMHVVDSEHVDEKEKEQHHKQQNSKKNKKTRQ